MSYHEQLYRVVLAQCVQIMEQVKHMYIFIGIGEQGSYARGVYPRTEYNAPGHVLQTRETKHQRKMSNWRVM